MVGNVWERLKALILKAKEFFKERWQTMGIMVIVALALDVITGIPGGVIGALLVK